MRIRHAVPADAAEVWAVRTRAIRHGCASHCPPEELAAWTARARPAPIPSRPATWSSPSARTGASPATRSSIPQEGAIEAAYVDPECARMGVARAPVDALEALVRTLRLPSLVVEASLNSVPFYGAIGYGYGCGAQHSLGGGASHAP